MCPFLSTLKMTLRRCVFLVWQEGKAARLSRLCALRACARTSNRARSTLYFGAPCHAVSPSPRALSPSASLARFDLAFAGDFCCHLTCAVDVTGLVAGAHLRRTLPRPTEGARAAWRSRRQAAAGAARCRADALVPGAASCRGARGRRLRARAAALMDEARRHQERFGRACRGARSDVGEQSRRGERDRPL